MLDREDYVEPACALCGKPGEEPALKPVPRDRILQKMREYEDRSDWNGAERHLKYWLEEAKAGRDGRGQLMLNNELMGFYRKQGKRKEAEEHRAAALELVQDRSLTINDRLRRLLATAIELDGGEEGDCPQENILPAYIKKLASLEILTPQWHELLQQKGGAPCSEEELAPLLEKVLVYDLFRFFLRGVYDGRALPWAKYAVFRVLTLRRLSRGRTRAETAELIRLCSKELEHSEENLAALHRAFCRRSGRFSAAGLRKAIEEEAQ